MIFHSTQIPHASLNRYGVVFMRDRMATPEETSVVVREAIAAGCRQEPSGDRDIGLVWVPAAPAKAGTTINAQL